MMKPEILQAYQVWLLEHGKRPASMYAFAQHLGLNEEEIYASFASFDAMEATIFAGWFDAVAQQLKSSPEYAMYGFREKVLALFFTWTEHLRGDRSLLLLLLHHIVSDGWNMEVLRREFKQFVQSMLDSGKATHEVADRLFVSDYYADVLWWQFRQVSEFWAKDSSNAFEQTDALIEKSVNFWVDLIQPNFVDSAFGLLKWAFNQR